MKTYEGSGGRAPTFLTWSLDGGEWSAVTSRNEEHIRGRSAWDFSVPFLGHTDRLLSRYSSSDIRTTYSTLSLHFFPEDEDNIYSETLVTIRQITRHRNEQ